MAKSVIISGIIEEFQFEELKFQVETTPEKEIDTNIGSNGGRVDVGFQMSEYIAGVNASGSRSITTSILGNVDSIATVIFLGAPKEKRFITQSSTFMIHEVRTFPMEPVTEDVSDEIKRGLEMENNRLAMFYSKHMDLSVDEIRGLMKDQTTFTAEQMVEIGIVPASNLVDTLEIAAYKNLESYKFKKTNMKLWNSNTKPKSLALADGNHVIFEGSEITEGTLINMITGSEAENYAGEYMTADNKTIMVDESNKVISIADTKTEPQAITEESVGQMIDSKLTPLLNEVQKIAVAIKTNGSTHKPVTANVNNSKPQAVSVHAKLRSTIKDIKNNFETERNN